MLYIPKRETEYSKFNEQIVTSRFPIIERKSAYPISNLTDIIEVDGGSITSFNGEYKISTSSNSTSFAKITTAEIGRYIAHSQSNSGIFLRIPSQPVGTQYVEWGLSDGEDSLLFGYDSIGTYVKHAKNGVEKSKVYSTDWDDTNGYLKREGLNSALGYVWSIDYAHYGGGNITFSIWTEDSNNRYQKYILHTLKLDEEIILKNPNLPLSVNVYNNGEPTAFDCFLGGRQYSVNGIYNPSFRINGDTGSFEDIGTTPTLLASFRKKIGNFQHINVRLNEFIISPDSITYWWIVKNNTLTGASWGNISYQQEGETAIEIDTTATNSLDGIVLSQGHAVGGGNKDVRLFEQSLNSVLTRQQPISIYIASKTLTVSGDWTIDFLEEW